MRRGGQVVRWVEKLLAPLPPNFSVGPMAFPSLRNYFLESGVARLTLWSSTLKLGVGGAEAPRNKKKRRLGFTCEIISVTSSRGRPKSEAAKCASHQNLYT